MGSGSKWLGFSPFLTLKPWSVDKFWIHLCLRSFHSCSCMHVVVSVLCGFDWENVDDAMWNRPCHLYLKYTYENKTVYFLRCFCVHQPTQVFKQLNGSDTCSPAECCCQFCQLWCHMNWWEKPQWILVEADKQRTAGFWGMGYQIGKYMEFSFYWYALHADYPVLTRSF